MLPVDQEGILSKTIDTIGSAASHFVPHGVQMKLIRRPSNDDQFEEVKKDIRSAIGLFLPLPELDAVLTVALQPNEPVDDRKLVTEGLLEILYNLPSDSPVSRFLESKFITTLWYDLQHPPIVFAGDKYRSVDGSNYSYAYPWLGKAGSRYARSVPIMRPLTIDRPDPYLIFDTVMVRKKFEPNPSHISSLLFSLAICITHEIFHSAIDDFNINQNSSYLDLSPLYGNSEKAMAKIRTFNRGFLKPDCIADYRPIGNLPSVMALLILFNRNHNWIANRLYQINEANQFRVQRGVDEKELDNRLFGAARLVNCGFFVNVILHDYLRSILGLNRTDKNWFLDPLQDFSKPTTRSTSLPRGTGNHVSIEFNQIYRWHPAISEQDEDWMNSTFPKMLNGDVSSMTHSDLLGSLAKWRNKLIGTDPATWTFDGLERNADGYFDDTELVKRITNGIEWVAGRFGPHHIPKIMRPVEVLAILQGRTAGTCSLNEFRNFLNLLPYSNFETMVDNKVNPQATQAMKVLYGNIWDVELYPGLMAEAAKPKVPGSGICLNYTSSRAILSDAVNLVRGDRFYAYMDAASYTTWGLHSSQSNPDIAYGTMMGKLLLRHFPRHFKPNSAYAYFAFNTPDEVRQNLKHNGIEEEFDFTRPITVKSQLPRVQLVNTFKMSAIVLSQPDSFRPEYVDKIADIAVFNNRSLIWDPSILEMDGGALQRAFEIGSRLTEGSVGGRLLEWTEATTEKLLHDGQRHLPEEAFFVVNVARDVCNMIGVCFLHDYFWFTYKQKEGPVSEDLHQQVYSAFADIGAYLLSEAEPELALERRMKARAAFPQLQKDMYKVVQRYGKGLLGKVLTDLTPFITPYRRDGAEMVVRLLENIKDSNEAAAILVITFSMIICTLGEVTTKAVAYFLAENQSTRFENEYQPIFASEALESKEKIRSIIREANRLDPYLRNFERLAIDDMEMREGQKISRGSIANVAIKDVFRDEQVFSNPNEFSYNRESSSYLCFGSLTISALIRTILPTIAAGVVGKILRKPGVRLNSSFRSSLGPVEAEGTTVFVNHRGLLTTFPQCLEVIYDM